MLTASTHGVQKTPQQRRVRLTQLRDGHRCKEATATEQTQTQARPDAAEERQGHTTVLASHWDTRGRPGVGTVLRRKSHMSTLALRPGSWEQTTNRKSSCELLWQNPEVMQSPSDRERGTGQSRVSGVFTVKVSL